MSATSKRKTYKFMLIFQFRIYQFFGRKSQIYRLKNSKRRSLDLKKCGSFFTRPVCRTSRLIVQLGKQFAGETKNPTAKAAEVALAAGPSLLVPIECLKNSGEPPKTPIGFFIKSTISERKFELFILGTSHHLPKLLAGRRSWNSPIPPDTCSPSRAKSPGSSQVLKPRCSFRKDACIRAPSWGLGGG